MPDMHYIAAHTTYDYYITHQKYVAEICSYNQYVMAEDENIIHTREAGSTVGVLVASLTSC